MRIYLNDEKFFDDAQGIGLDYRQIQRIAKSQIWWDDELVKALPVAATCKVCGKRVEYLKSKKNWRNRSKWSKVD